MSEKNCENHLNLQECILIQLSINHIKILKYIATSALDVENIDSQKKDRKKNIPSKPIGLSNQGLIQYNFLPL